MTLLTTILSVFLITANPGCDASKEISINWHCTDKGSRLELTGAGDPTFSKAEVFNPDEELWSLEYGDSLAALPRYVCRVELNGLKKGTKYLYRVIEDGNVSRTRSFTTASGSQKWNFMAFADFQTRYNELTHPIIAKTKELSKGATMAICSGDLTDYGAVESEWRWALDNEVWDDLVFAASPGDHEYWCPRETGTVPMMNRPEFFTHALDLPKNGIEERPGSNYYFFYNNAMIVAMDMGDSNTSIDAIYPKEAEWLKKVAKENAGKYRWLIVMGHKSQYGSPITDSGVVKYMQPIFAPAFKEAGVDLVISGHDHKYSRTREIDGTYYLDLGSSGKKYRVPEPELYTDGIHERVINLKDDSICLGAVVDITSKTLTVTVYDLQGGVRDSFTKKK